MPERPIECIQCQKPIDVTYKEISLENTICTEMCSECPILAKKLHGQSTSPYKNEASKESIKVCCALCLTTIESIQTGNLLGCSLCYEVFDNLLIEKLIDENLLSSLIQKEIINKKPNPIHTGKSPKQSITIPFSNQAATLTAALSDAIQKEHYEQAAWLRDQIKELKEKENERKNQSS